MWKSQTMTQQGPWKHDMIDMLEVSAPFSVSLFRHVHRESCLVTSFLGFHRVQTRLLCAAADDEWPFLSTVSTVVKAPEPSQHPAWQGVIPGWSEAHSPHGWISWFLVDSIAPPDQMLKHNYFGWCQSRVLPDMQNHSKVIKMRH